MSASSEVLLACAELEVGFGGQAILPPIDLEIRAGEIWAVLGRNGAGKTTLFRTILGMLPAVGGAVRKRSPDLRFSYVPQRSALDDMFPMLAREVVAQGCDRGWSFLTPRRSAPAGVLEALRAMDVLELADRSFRTLSEGQKQRVLLARLAASRADLALLDEPTAAMDVVAEKEAFGYIDRLRSRHDTAFVVVSHDLSVAFEHADRAVFIDNAAGAVVVGAPDTVLAHPAFIARYGENPLGKECVDG